MDYDVDVRHPERYVATVQDSNVRALHIFERSS